MIANIMLVINIVLEMFSSIRTRREVRCSITRAVIGNCVVGMCFIYAVLTYIFMCVRTAFVVGRGSAFFANAR